MIEKLQWMYRILTSKTYVVLTDKSAVVHIPLTDIAKFRSYHLLAAQTAALYDFKSRLEEVINEHEKAVNSIADRNGNRKNNSKRKTSNTKVRKPANKRNS